MPKPFTIGVEIEEIALGQVLRKLHAMPGIVALHMNMDIDKAGIRQSTKPPNGSTEGAEAQRRRGRPPKSENGNGETGTDVLIAMLRGGKTLSVGEMRDGFSATGRSPASISSLLHALQKSGKIVRAGRNAYTLKKRQRSK